jgi:hypothetical protein
LVTLPLPLVGKNAALAIAHPGHELRVHGWLEQARPHVFILTDGSRPTGTSRIPSTVRLLQSAGATLSPLSPMVPDAVVYRALLDANIPFFLRVTESLARALEYYRIDMVVGDAAEGYNSVHDIWRLLIDTAIALTPQRILNLSYPLVGGHATPTFFVELDDEALQRKLVAAQQYAELDDEVREQLARFGVEHFRTETFTRIEGMSLLDVPNRPHYYETHGEEQMQAGRYPAVIRFRDHVLPVVKALTNLTRKRAG